MNGPHFRTYVLISDFLVFSFFVMQAVILIVILIVGMEICIESMQSFAMLSHSYVTQF